MKKILIATMSMAIGIVANAASVNWGSGTIFVASDSLGTTGAGAAYKATLATGARPVTAYLYAITAEEYVTYSSFSQIDLYKAFEGKSALAEKTTVGNGTANITQSVADAIGDVYSVIIYKDTANANLPKGADAFVKIAVAKANVGGAGAVSVFNLASSVESWSAVPEPTSAMLIVLGMAALALRRKRA